MNLRTPLATMTAMNTPGGGRRIVLVAPLTEIIDRAGFFIQMSLASLPVWMEGSESEYPQWRQLEDNEDGTAR
jgi:hypothetical protein